MPNLLLQMLVRSANAVGYTNYPDNVVRYFIEQAAKGGIDVFRVFDCLNWVENMKVSIEAVRRTGRLCEAAICYTGNLSNPRETKYDLRYYLDIAASSRRWARMCSASRTWAACASRIRPRSWSRR
jgi:pyruvate carboxylase